MENEVLKRSRSTCKFSNFSCLFRVSTCGSRVCIDIHKIRNMKHEVFVFRVPNSNTVLVYAIRVLLVFTNRELSKSIPCTYVHVQQCKYGTMNIREFLFSRKNKLTLVAGIIYQISFTLFQIKIFVKISSYLLNHSLGKDFLIQLVLFLSNFFYEFMYITQHKIFQIKT